MSMMNLSSFPLCLVILLKILERVIDWIFSVETISCFSIFLSHFLSFQNDKPVCD